MTRVAGKVALVTGAARGQGRSHAVMLAAEGADIIAVDACADIESNEYPLARPEDLEETARLVEKEGRRVVSVVCDVRDRAKLGATIDAAVAELGGLDAVVANAGIAPLSRGQSIQAFVDAIDVDFIGAVNTISAALGHLRSGASIVAIGSFAAFSDTVSNRTPGSAGYSFAKKVLAQYVNDLAVQLAGQMIRVNAVHPTNCNTDMLHSKPIYEQFLPDVEQPTREQANAAFPVLHAMPIPYVEPVDVSYAVLYLCSDESRYVTGLQMRVDGGAYIKRRPWSV
ncbi:MAG: dehydrogenase, short-chain alcohol dehydrogenase like protein [Mycobacterium sp.]|jgi:SDR family mycofactocin-dependent oxidoreductase|nr:dehydrogenase, short-chain alcohol dehydrogenase like protein [Mycobacterium sp.]